MAANKKAKILSAEQILSARDFETKEVKVPEWKGSVLVRVLTEGDYMDWIRASRETEVDASIDLFVRAVCDEDGDLLFTHDAAEALRGKSIKAMNRVVEGAMEINGLKIQDEEALVGKLRSPESDSPTD